MYKNATTLAYYLFYMKMVKSVHFKEMVAQSSFLSKVLTFSPTVLISAKMFFAKSSYKLHHRRHTDTAASKLSTGSKLIINDNEIEKVISLVLLYNILDIRNNFIYQHFWLARKPIWSSFIHFGQIWSKKNEK